MVVMALVSVNVPSGAVKVTGSPLTAVEVASKTVTERLVANCVPAVVLWGVPPAVVTACGTNVFDMKKSAVEVDDPMEAITL